MIHITDFAYKPTESEAEKASNGYLMSVIALMVGLPFPFINLLATFFFYISNRKSTYFVKWHCTQALLSQFSIFIMNSIAVTWTLSILFGPISISNYYIAYIITVLLYNLTEFIITVISAVNTRKGKHPEWWFYGSIVNLIVKPENEKAIF